jgi:signal peptidase I
VCSALAVVAGVYRLHRGWAVITVEGPSMEPTLREGDRVVVRRTPPFRIATGEVVVTEQPGRDGAWHHPPGQLRGGRQWMIKRVGAVAGEPVPDGIPVPDAVVPEGKLVLLGDNPGASYDSRKAGYFPADRLLGGVLRRML